MQEMRADVRRAGRRVAWLAVIALVLVVLHVVAMWVYYEDPWNREAIGLRMWHLSVFDLDEEESFGTWFSAVLLLYAGRLLLERARLARGAPGGMWAWWILLAGGFHFLSLDEVVGIHEYVNTLTEGTPWTVYGAVVVGATGLLYLPFLNRQGWWTGGLFAIAGALYVGGAIGVEHGTEWFAEQDLLATLEYNLWTAVEEALEMAGVLVFLYALLDDLRTRALHPQAAVAQPFV